MSYLNLTEVDLDADWPIFDNIRPVIIYNKLADDVDSAVGVIVDGLDVAFDVSERYAMEAAGDDAGEIFEAQTTIALRTADIGFKPFPGVKVVDWDARAWRVKRATLKSMDTRVMIVITRPNV